MGRRTLEGQAALVTGAGAGIGLGACEALARRGARVALVDRSADALTEATRRLGGLGPEALPLRAEVSVAAEVRATVEAALGRFGRLDILVNCAGGFFEVRETEEIEEEEWDAILASNLKSVYLCCRAAIAPMKRARYGRIVSISSMAGRMAVPHTASHYTAAKAGVLGFTRQLALELAPFGITVNAVAPGVTDTPRIRVLHASRLEAIREATPLGRLAAAGDVAEAIAFLASPAASFITGVCLDVTGGRFMA